MGPRLDVDPVTYEAASAAFGMDIAGTVERAAGGLADGLADAGGMAGSDPAGTTWARAYDAAAALTTGVTQDVINGCYQLAALLQQTGFNYGRAESWSTPGALDELVDSTDYATCSVRLPNPPSASGGSAAPPGAWWLIEQAVGYVWPNGEQDLLRGAAAAWTAAGAAIADATLFVSSGLECIAAQVSPEVEDAMTTCQAMDGHLWEVASAYRAVAGACSDFAGYLDKAHSQVEHELASLAEWTAGIQAGGALLSILTAGGSEAAAQGAEAGRVATAVAKVSGIIAEFVERAGAAAETISNAATRVVEVSHNLAGLLAARISVASGRAVEALPALGSTEQIATENLAASAAATTPKLSIARTQIEKKFKHAPVFGVTAARGADGYDAFSVALDDFVHSPTTSRVVGTYRNSPAVLNYSVASRLVVVQSSDGAFVSCWRMSVGQLRNVIERRSLGGG